MPMSQNVRTSAFSLRIEIEATMVYNFHYEIQAEYNYSRKGNDENQRHDRGLNQACDVKNFVAGPRYDHSVENHLHQIDRRNGL